MRNTFIISISCFLIASFFLFVPAHAQNRPYSIEFIITNNTINPTLTTPGISFKTTEDCRVTLKQYLTAEGNDYNIYSALYSPGGTSIGSGPLNNQNNLNCKFLGSGSSFPTPKEGKSYISLTGGSNIYAALTTDFYCESTINYWINFSVNPAVDSDSYGGVPNRMVYFKNDLEEVDQYRYSPDYFLKPENYNNCNSNFTVSQQYFAYNEINTGSYPLDMFAWFVYPFNSTGGIVTYEFAGRTAAGQYTRCKRTWDVGCTPHAGENSLNYSVYLYDFDSDSLELLTNQEYAACGSSYSNIYAPVSGIRPLARNKMFAFIVEIKYKDGDEALGYYTADCDRQIDIYEPPFNFSVWTYQPNLECNEWSDCEAGTQIRTCIDLYGINGPEYEVRNCDIDVLENATLGFEQYITDYDIVKCIPGWFLGCQYSAIENYERDSPAGWNIEEGTPKRDFLSMTNEWATEGQRALKMWFIPSKDGEPLETSPPYTCGNQSSGQIPIINQTLSNDTLGAYYNVSFPAPNMLLSFDVKGCTEQVEHSGELRTLFDTILLCPKSCYSGNCSTVPDSQYQFYLTDEYGNTITYYFGQADIYQGQKIQMDLTGLNLAVNTNYTLKFRARPETLNSQAGNCVMFDNVKYEVLAEPYLNLIGGDCSVGNKCIGSTLYQTHFDSYLNTCSVVKVEDSPDCLSGELKEKVANKEDYCKNENTLRTFNFDKGAWVSVSCDVCYENECYTFAEYAELTAGEVETPTDINDYVAIFFSAVFIVSLLILGLCLFAAIKLGGEAWPIALFGIGQLVFVLSIYQVIPVYIAIAEIVLAVAIVAYFISKPARGG